MVVKCKKDKKSDILIVDLLGRVAKISREVVMEPSNKGDYWDRYGTKYFEDEKAARAYEVKFVLLDRLFKRCSMLDSYQWSTNRKFKEFVIGFIPEMHETVTTATRIIKPKYLSKELGTLEETIPIMGYDYSITLASEADTNGKSGYADWTVREITLCVVDPEEDKTINLLSDLFEWTKCNLTHEIIHCYLDGIGLLNYSDFARDEEMVDWLAQNFEVLNRIFTQVDEWI